MSFWKSYKLQSVLCISLNSNLSVSNIGVFIKPRPSFIMNWKSIKAIFYSLCPPVISIGLPSGSINVKYQYGENTFKYLIGVK